MYGICGIISKNSIELEELMHMNGDHRDPNDSGEVIIQENNFCVGLAYQRRSILDLSSLEQQPLMSENGRYTVAFDGKIYNSKKLRSDLSREYSFVSKCDAEVILAAFEKWQWDCFYHLEGMFAIAIYDHVEKQLYLIRDRIGKKPLFYYISDKSIVFASELKALYANKNVKKEINFSIISDYLYHGYFYGKCTVFKDVYKVLPGSIMKISDFIIEERKYWYLPDEYNKISSTAENLSYDETRIIVKELLEKAVKVRLQSDVPMGVFLSGGVDSSLVAAIMRKYSNEKVRTYTIGFNETGYNEAEFARNISEYLQTVHTEKYISEKALFDILGDYAKYIDEPIGDPAIIPTLFLSKIAVKDVSVILTGDGGDEVFCGYDSYDSTEIMRMLDRFKRFVPSKRFLYGNHNRMISRLYSIKNNDCEYAKTQCVIGAKAWMADSLMGTETQGEYRYEIEGMFDTTDWIRKRMLVDSMTILPDCFMVKNHRATMAHCLEARSPLLDRQLIETSYKIPMEYLRAGGIKKKILKDILADYIPREVFDRPKRGFVVPIGKWLSNELYGSLCRYADRKAIQKQGIFDGEFLNELISKYKKNKIKNPGCAETVLWNFYIFQIWYQQYVNDLWNS